MSDIHINTGSDFFGRIAIKDIHGKRYLISEGDEIRFFIRTEQKTEVDPLCIVLTCDDEIMGKYSFRLESEVTEQLEGNYYYYAFIRFADGGNYQIIPDTPIKIQRLKGTEYYPKYPNIFEANVPRRMKIPDLSGLMMFISEADGDNSNRFSRFLYIHEQDIVILENIDTERITPAELIDSVRNRLEYYGIEAPYAAGFFHADERPEYGDYLAAAKEYFGEKFIDVETILKTPVYKDGDIVSSTAMNLLKVTPTADDIALISDNKYPGYIQKDETHFNKNGCYAAAKVIFSAIGIDE